MVSKNFLAISTIVNRCIETFLLDVNNSVTASEKYFPVVLFIVLLTWWLYLMSLWMKS